MHLDGKNAINNLYTSVNITLQKIHNINLTDKTTPKKYREHPAIEESVDFFHKFLPFECKKTQNTHQNTQKGPSAQRLLPTNEKIFNLQFTAYTRHP